MDTTGKTYAELAGELDRLKRARHAAWDNVAEWLLIDQEILALNEVLRQRLVACMVETPTETDRQEAAE